jgi:hypothetical protein
MLWNWDRGSNTSASCLITIVGLQNSAPTNLRTVRGGNRGIDELTDPDDRCTRRSIIPSSGV